MNIEIEKLGRIILVKNLSCGVHYHTGKRTKSKTLLNISVDVYDLKELLTELEQFLIENHVLVSSKNGYIWNVHEINQIVQGEILSQDSADPFQIFESENACITDKFESEEEKHLGG